MDEFLHDYEMESLQLGITARRDVVDQLRALFPEGDVGRLDGFLATTKALAARREHKSDANEQEEGEMPRICRLRVAGNAKENFHRRLRNIQVVALTNAVLKSHLTGIVALDWPYNHLGEEIGDHEGDRDHEEAKTGDEHGAMDERMYRLDTASCVARLLQVRRAYCIAIRSLGSLPTYACLQSTAVYTSVIQEVDLHGNYLGGESYRLLCSALLEAGDSCALRCLNLRGNPLGLAGGHAIAELLRSTSCTIEELDVGDARLQVANLIAIATALRENSRLRALNLDNPFVQTKEEEAVQHIGKMLQVNDTLETLSLGKHQLTDHGAQVLAERMLDNAALRCLSLRANRIGTDGAEVLAALSLRHRGLQELDLGANRIGDAGGKAFARALDPVDGAASTSSIKALALCSTSMTDEGIAAIVAACIRQRQCSGSDGGGLASLLLWDNEFGRDSAQKIMELAQGGEEEDARLLEMDVVAWKAENEQGVVRIARRELPTDSPAAKFTSPKR